MNPSKQPVRDALLGLAVGDALGVPVEFQPRSHLTAQPVEGMRGYGTYQQPAGTWSDDSSLTFCLADSLCGGYDLADMAHKFIQWKAGQLWTPHGVVFDIGNTTSYAIDQLNIILRSGNPSDLKYLPYAGATEFTNGNGSLMRILPLLFYLRGRGLDEQLERIREVSALTHGHLRATLACAIYLRLAEYLLHDYTPLDAYRATQGDIRRHWQEREIAARECRLFSGILEADLHERPESSIRSDGYVLHSLEAALWCFLRESSYEATVLRAVNLGGDTDTTAAIVGGLAGLYYGAEGIPTHWRNALARLEAIEDLCHRLQRQYKAIPPPMVY